LESLQLIKHQKKLIFVASQEKGLPSRP